MGLWNSIKKGWEWVKDHKKEVGIGVGALLTGGVLLPLLGVNIPIVSSLSSGILNVGKTVLGTGVNLGGKLLTGGGKFLGNIIGGPGGKGLMGFIPKLLGGGQPPAASNAPQSGEQVAKGWFGAGTNGTDTIQTIQTQPRGGYVTAAPQGLTTLSNITGAQAATYGGAPVGGVPYDPNNPQQIAASIARTGMAPMDYSSMWGFS